jgi:hypothetical protein
VTRYIFSINSGRSGSEYLAKLLDTAGNASAYHEPWPDGAGRYVTRFPATHPSPAQLLLYPPMYLRKYWKKIRTIRRTARHLPKGDVYIETNHMFILSFYDVVMRHLEPVDVILMRRYLPAAVRSFIQLDHYTPQCPYTKWWFTSPNSPSRAAQPLDRDENLSQVEQIIGYLIDIEARAQRFKRRFPHVKVVETHIGELNDPARVQQIFAELDLEVTPETLALAGRVINDKPEHKARVGREVSIEWCKEEIAKYLEKAKQRGIEVPALPQMNDDWRRSSKA